MSELPKSDSPISGANLSDMSRMLESSNVCGDTDNLRLFQLSSEFMLVHVKSRYNFIFFFLEGKHSLCRLGAFYEQQKRLIIN